VLGKNHSWYRVPDKQSDTTIIFVHGIFSSSEACWKFDGETSAQDAFWPQIVKQDADLAHCAIYLAGYYTELASGKFSSADAAESMREHLTQSPASGQPIPLEKSNIVFVAHSTGGLVVRRLMQRFPEVFRNKKVGLVLVASPSLGSKYADWLYNAAIIYGNKMAQGLSKSDPGLKDLDDEFRLILEKNREDRGYCLGGIDLHENKFILGGAVAHLLREVVAEDDLGKYFGKPRRIGKTDHLTIAKPAGPDSEVHVFLRGYLQNAFRKMDCPTVPAPKIRKFVASRTTDNTWNLNLRLDTRDIPSEYRIRVEISDDRMNWNSGKTASDDYEVLDYDAWRAASGSSADAGFAFGEIRGTAKFVRLAVLSREGQVIAVSDFASISE
jgi:pimeloyl-ACP methyl ester carboxylesterase